MTTFQDLLDKRLVERQAELEALASADAEKRERIAMERSKVLWLFQRDILKGATLPPGASIAAPVSNEHGHQVVVRFPGNLSIDAEHLYTVLDGALLASGPRYNQRWIARVHPAGEQKTFDDFIDAALWLLPPPIVAEQPAMNKLLEAAQAVTAGPGLESQEKLVALKTQLARYRCTCGAFPTEGHVDCWWMVRCCGNEWESWDEFLAWREEQDAKASTP